ncbi:MAG: hypothetical protein GX085_01255 [Firmicutes bacterium]|nr:hypothetical protein [Bacillota bacterium]
MWKKVPVLLIIVVLFFPGLIFAGTWDYYPEHNAWLLLSTGEVNLGLPAPGPSGDDYWEARNALLIIFQCLKRGRRWQVSLNGGDFVAGNHAIKRHRMEWRTASGSYQSLKPAGHELVLAQSGDYPGSELNLHLLLLSFRLSLAQWEPAGEYAGEMRVTLFCW